MKSSYLTMCLAATVAMFAIASSATAAPLEVGALTHSSAAAANSETFTANDRVLLTTPISPVATPAVVAFGPGSVAAFDACANNGQAMSISAINYLDAADLGARDRGLLLVT